MNSKPPLAHIFNFSVDRVSNWIIQHRRRATAGLALAALAVFAPTARAHPSGGPYGPVQLHYEVPESAKHVFYVAPDATSEASGVQLDQPATLANAIERAQTGDAIILRGGVYRTGNLVFNQGITLQPYGDEHPVLKGTEVATEWKQQKNGLWRTTWTHLFPMKPADWWRRESSGKLTPPYRFNNDMVFLDGELLHAVGWEGELDEHSYYIDYDKQQVYLAIDPTKHLVEITAHDSALVRTIKDAFGRTSDRRGPTIRGLTFTQYAYRALEVEATEPERLADPATFGKEVVGTTLENVTITFCSRVAAYIRGDKLVFRHCRVSDTRTEGLYVISSADVLIEKNIFERNNIENISGYFPSAVKIFNQCYRATCRDNLVMDQPYSNGIWYDVGNVDGRFVDNWIEGCMDGFFFEISKGAICTGNVFVNCDKGVRVLNSSNVQVYQNTFVNSVASFERNERSAVGDHFGWHPSTGPDVDQREGHAFVHNLLMGDENFHKPLLRFEQPAALCGRLTRPMVKELDANVYVRRGTAPSGALLVWSPIQNEKCQIELDSLEAFRKLQPAFETHSVAYEHYFGPLFLSLELHRFGLQLGFPGAGVTAELPPSVRQLLGWTASNAAYPGAFPVEP